MYRFTPRSYSSDEAVYGRPSSAFDNYVNAKKAFEAAEAEYVAAQAVQQEEDALRLRLEEIQLQKRLRQPAPYHTLPERATYHPYSPERPTSDLYATDRLAFLRLQVEEEERKRAQVEREAAARRKDIEGAVLRRQVEQVHAARLRQQQEEAAAKKLLVLRAKQQRDLQARDALITQSSGRHPVVRLVVKPKETAVPDVPQFACRGRCAPRVEKAAEPTIEGLLGLLGNASVPAVGEREPKVSFAHHSKATRVPTHTSQNREPASSNTRPELQDIFTQLLGGVAESTKPKVEAKPTKPTPSPSNARPEVGDLFSNLLDGFIQATKPDAEAGARTTASKSDSPVGLENIFSQLFGGEPESSSKKPEASTSAPATKSSTKSAPLAAEPSQAKPHVHWGTPSAEPASSAKETSLKDQLEARLYGDEATEIKDTIQAILASLADAPASAASTTTPAAPASSTSSDNKGKGKAPAAKTPSHSFTTRDVASSMEAVRSIESAFTALESDFVIPSNLDFLLPTEDISSPTSSDSESTTSKLAFTAHNQPVRFHEQALSALVAQLDEVESFGNEELRNRRKQVVGKVEKALEDLESEVEGRWRSRMNKLKRVSVEVAQAEAPAVLPVPEQASEEAGAVVADNSEDEPKPREVDEEPVLLNADEGTDQPIDYSTRAIAENAVDQPEHVDSVEDTTPETNSANTVVATEESHPEPPSSYPSNVSASATEPPAYTVEISESEPSLSYPPQTTEPTTPEAYDVESDVDTFLLPATDGDDSEKKKVGKEEREDAGSDWSEVEA